MLEHKFLFFLLLRQQNLELLMLFWLFFAIVSVRFSGAPAMESCAAIPLLSSSRSELVQLVSSASAEPFLINQATYRVTKIDLRLGRISDKRIMSKHQFLLKTWRIRHVSINRMPLLRLRPDHYFAVEKSDLAASAM